MFTRLLNSKLWLHCNGAADLRVDENKVKKHLILYLLLSFFSYISLCKRAWISFIFCGSGDPICNCSP